MIAGHFGLAAGIKAKERAIPLWSLMLATVWLDVVFLPLLIAGIETTEKMGEGGYGDNLIHADYTHSLVGAIVLSTVLGALFARRWSGRSGVVLALVSFSHWLLDFVVHREDLPVWPGGRGELGLGLWESTMVSIAVEAVLVLVGGLLYWRAARSVAGSGTDDDRHRARTLGIALLAAGLLTLSIDVLIG